MAPFRVFVSSPVYEIEEYRQAVREQAALARASRAYDIFFFEEHDIPRLPDCSICESIFAACGNYFDAFFVFFRDRIGPGTLEEFNHFETVLLNENKNCQLWWAEIQSGPKPQEVLDFIGRLQRYNTGLPIATSSLPLDSAKVLTGQFVVK
jgi:hypothetical protein